MNEKLLDEMLESPHLLIAGMTGSGKSVLLNQFISQLDGCGIICIDLKKVELYEHREKALAYADNTRDTIILLNQVLDGIERRYTKMQAKGIKLWRGSDIYVVIDELADLMITSRKQAEPLLIRIGQIGRAAKVHLVMATQQPSAKVIPTSIKLNCDRLALHCQTAAQSRQILDEAGAEELPRVGRCIFHGKVWEITL